LTLAFGADAPVPGDDNDDGGTRDDDHLGQQSEPSAPARPQQAFTVSREYS
jgi:hypothetical protein